jgi:hypothetical protein
MKYALIITHEEDQPTLIYSGELKIKQLAQALRAVVDRLDPVVIPIKAKK